MEIKLKIEDKEEAEKLIKQLQDFIYEKEKERDIYPNIKKGSMFYVIGNDEKVVGMNYYPSFYGFKNSLANIYETKEIAERALAFKKSRKVWNFIENWVMHNNVSSYKPNWNDDSIKYSVNYSHITKKWFIGGDAEIDRGRVYLPETEAIELIKILNSSDEYKL